MTDCIEKRIELRAPVAKVWRALTDYQEFSQWFQVNMRDPFVPGQPSRGRITYPGYEHLTMEIVVKEMEPDRLFSFTWHPNATDASRDYSAETPTLVEFHLEKIAGGTLLTLTESGFGQIPPDRRASAFRSNDGGWTEQMKNIQTYVENAREQSAEA